MRQNTTKPTFGVILQKFFVEYLMQQRHASLRTIAAYRDSFQLLLSFAEQQLEKMPDALALEDINASLILKFLSHLERDRHNTIRSRNARFAAIRSFMHYVSRKVPTGLYLAQEILAIPMKRFDRPLIGFLSREQIESLLAAPDPDTWSGQRDRVMFATLYNTGARVSELIGMRFADLSLAPPTATIRIRGKGRKERCIPLWQNTVVQLRRWLKICPRAPEDPLFPNRTGREMTRTGVSERLKLAANIADHECPELGLRKMHISPHVFRHSTAMHLLQSGVDITVIALWLGHENPATTHSYVEADITMKERALKAMQPPQNAPLRYRATNQLLKFLKSL